jgi:hypothetical protein
MAKGQMIDLNYHFASSQIISFNLRYPNFVLKVTFVVCKGAKAFFTCSYIYEVLKTSNFMPKKFKQQQLGVYWFELLIIAIRCPFSWKIIANNQILFYFILFQFFDNKKMVNSSTNLENPKP